MPHFEVKATVSMRKLLVVEAFDEQEANDLVDQYLAGLLDKDQKHLIIEEKEIGDTVVDVEETEEI